MVNNIFDFYLLEKDMTTIEAMIAVWKTWYIKFL